MMLFTRLCRPKYFLVILTLAIFVIIGLILITTSKELIKYKETNSFIDINLELGRWDNQHKYKIFDNLLIGEKYVTLSYEFKTCLATQSSLDRLHSLTQVADHWNGPISVATYAESEDKLNILLLYIYYLRKCFAQIRNKVTFHLMLVKERAPRKYRVPNEYLEKLDCRNSSEAIHVIRKILKIPTMVFQPTIYPQNHLRNLARKNCQTEFVFLTDVDIISSKGIAEELDKFLTKEECVKCAYVVPTYELDHSVNFPQNKKELIKFATKGLARPFHQEVFNLNQKATRFERWENIRDRGEGIYKVYKANKENMYKYYEPFYIAPDTVPPHDERFIGYGYTRNTQVQEMIAMGYTFWVLTPIFTIHWGYQKLRSRPHWRYQQLRANGRLWSKFMKEICLKHKVKCKLNV